MNLLFVLFNVGSCTLEEVEILLWQFNAIQLELNGFSTTCQDYFIGFLNHVKEGKESPEKEKSKDTIRSILYEASYSYLASIYEHAFDYLENIQKMVDEHITKVESDEYTIDYQYEITISNNNLVGNKTSFIKCKEEFEKIKTRSDDCASSEDVISEHRLLLNAVNAQSHRLYTKQLELMERGQMVAIQILKILKDIVEKMMIFLQRCKTCF